MSNANAKSGGWIIARRRKDGFLEFYSCDSFYIRGWVNQPRDAFIPGSLYASEEQIKDSHHWFNAGEDGYEQLRVLKAVIEVELSGVDTVPPYKEPSNEQQ